MGWLLHLYCLRSSLSLGWWAGGRVHVIVILGAAIVSLGTAMFSLVTLIICLSAANTCLAVAIVCLDAAIDCLGSYLPRRRPWLSRLRHPLYRHSHLSGWRHQPLPLAQPTLPSAPVSLLMAPPPPRSLSTQYCRRLCCHLNLYASKVK